MEGGTQLPPPAEMDGETLLLPPPAAVEAEMEGETQPPPLPACVSKVLDDDNLLAEIIVRLGFPTSLVHAASVCRRWLLLASGRAFLRRFRKLHPPRLLGFYLEQSEYPGTVAHFFPMKHQPPPPELAAVVRRVSSILDFYEGEWTNMRGCWNGRVVTSLHLCHLSGDNDSRDEIRFVVRSPLCSERGMAVIPTLHLPFHQGYLSRSRQLFSKEEGDVLSYIYLLVESNNDGTKSMVHLYMLQNGDDAWRAHLTLVADYLIYASPNAVLVDDKIYMESAGNEIVVLDLTTSGFFTVQLPQGVDFHTTDTTMLSRADDASDVYLIHAQELQIHIWLHKRGNWLLVDNICLREMCASFLEDDPTALLKINHVGDYTAEFLFLEMGRFALYLDVKCRTLRKVYEMTREDQYIGTIFPFMMIWPPFFPCAQGWSCKQCHMKNKDKRRLLDGR